MTNTETTTMQNLDAFTRAYIECALWSSNDNSNEQGGDPLDKNYDVDDIAPITLSEIIEDCRQFQSDNAELLTVQSDEQNGHGPKKITNGIMYTTLSYGRTMFVTLHD